MKKIKVIVDNNQKEKSFNLIKIIIKDFANTLGSISQKDPSNDIFMRTTRNLFSNLNQDITEILESDSDTFELSVYNVHIFKDALEFYWQNSKSAFIDYDETDYINAQKLLAGNTFASFVK